MYNRDLYGYISNIFMRYHDIFDVTYKSWYIFQYLYWSAAQRNNIWNMFLVLENLLDWVKLIYSAQKKIFGALTIKGRGRDSVVRRE